MNNEKRDFDKAAASWDEPGRVKLANDIAQAIIDAIALAPTMDVLDFGCGTGLLTLKLRPLVHSITGVDSSQGMLDVLNAKIKNQDLTDVKTQHRDLDKGDALEGSYHLIISSMTLHHIREIRPLLDKFSKACAPDGYLCIADLDPDGGRFHGNNDGVFHFGFDRAMMRRAFIEAGFHDVRDKTAAHIMKPIPDEGSRLFSVFLMTGRKSL
jgi:2-polyprenyl-3-methyl-5-hydroxy-6-metoxy-1,4-benzoquinol methylase